MTAESDVDRGRSIARHYPLHRVLRECLAHEIAHTVEDERRGWLNWLAEIGYGVDFTHDPHPPCAVREVAEAYNELTPLDNDANEGETGADVHVWVIGENTGWKDDQ